MLSLFVVNRIKQLRTGQASIERVLHLQDFGLDLLDEDGAIVGFAQKAEAKLVRWLDFAKGALLFLMVPGDGESGTFYATTATGRPSIRSRFDRAPLRRFSRRRVSISHESL